MIAKARVRLSQAGLACYANRKQRYGEAWPQREPRKKWWVLWDGARIPVALPRDYIEVESQK